MCCGAGIGCVPSGRQKNSAEEQMEDSFTFEKMHKLKLQSGSIKMQYGYWEILANPV